MVPTHILDEILRRRRHPIQKIFLFAMTLKPTRRYRLAVPPFHDSTDETWMRHAERYLFPNSCLNVGEIFLFSFFPPIVEKCST